MIGILRRLTGLARAETPEPAPEAYQRAAMRSAIRADGNSRINANLGAASQQESSGALWDRVISRMNKTY